MPIYEYSCKKCGHFFEELVKNGQKIKCPKCRSGMVEKKFSIFSNSAGSDVSSGSSNACSGCSSTNCGSCGVA